MHSTHLHRASSSFPSKASRAESTEIVISVRLATSVSQHPLNDWMLPHKNGARTKARENHGIKQRKTAIKGAAWGLPDWWAGKAHRERGDRDRGRDVQPGVGCHPRAHLMGTLRSLRSNDSDAICRTGTGTRARQNVQDRLA